MFKLKISVWGKEIPLSNTITIWQQSAGDEKSIPALKFYILWDMADSIPYLVPTQFLFQFGPITRPKYRLRFFRTSGQRITFGLEKI
jgi:hypothetical protein